MLINIIAAFFILNVSLLYIESKTQFLYDVKEIEVPVDHFNFVNDEKFLLRYLINDSNTDESSPIFFYTGNEGDIELFAKNSGFLWELSYKFKAILVFAEHRYYGKSLPFGKDSFNKTSHYGFLNVEQTLADYAQLVFHIRNTRNVPVIAFGGSYGGMLAAWFRMKYPHLVYGALAASAPIWQFNSLTPCDIFAKILTSVFNSSYSSNCSFNIKRSWDVFINVSSTETGRLELQKVFNFCDPITKSEDVHKFLDYLDEVYENLAMANYPYKNDFLAPLPAYPVRQFCFYLKDTLNEDMDLINAMQSALSVYTNSSGTTKCLNYTSAYDPKLGGNAWDIQACTEMVMPMCFPKETMFRVKKWNFNDYSDNCFNKYKVRPKENAILIEYGGKNLESASNIIFSNGLLDPWSGGGVLQTTNNKIVIIIIPEGAHHLDLRSANANDPKSVVEARKQEIEVISKWLSQYK